MTSNDFQRIEEAFRQALTLDGGARERHIASFERDHPGTGDRLRKLLAADASNEDTLATPIAASVRAMADEAKNPWIGRKVGAWTIKNRIGAGGMGAVFLADRDDDQYAQTVAVKIMAAQLIDPNAIARFRAERQILANLNHPNIATLIDGGATDTDLPFLVMEFVDGLRVDEYCDANKLEIPARLKLFQKICDAVDFAHRNLVVHRDLKPSNILVDQSGAPKLLDFGIAKLLAPGGYDMTMAQTGEGVRAMTPEYASPEQVRGEPVSVATDVYALGVLLFRLLTGHSPYGATVSTPREIESAILDTDPKRPSTIITEAPDSASDHSPSSPEEIGANRATSPDRLRKSLSGDLDNIVLKCLQKEPERRYATARELAADLDRYLTNKPVLARGDSWTYKTQKFLVRHARPVAAAAVLLLTVISLVTYYTVQLTVERDRATLAAEQSKNVSDFLVEIFASADPFVSQGTPVTAIELLDAAQLEIEQLSDQPQLQAELFKNMGDSYQNLGETETAINLLERSLALVEAQASPDPLRLADIFHSLNETHRLHGNLDKAADYILRALALREQELGPAHEEVARTLGRLGTLQFDQREMDAALSSLQRALEIKRNISPKDDSITVDILGNIGITMDSMGRYNEAEPVLREAVLLSSQIDGALNPNTIIRTNNLGLVYMRLLRFEDAEKTFSIALQGARRVWPENHPNIARYTGTSAAALKRLGRFQEARAKYEEAAAITRAGAGERSNDYVARLRGVGAVLMDMGFYNQADATFEKAVALAVELNGNDHYLTAQLKSYLGRSKMLQLNAVEAELLLRAALEQEQKLGASRVLVCKRDLAVSLSLQGKSDEAESLFTELIEAVERQSGKDNLSLAPLLEQSAAHYRRVGQLQKSLAHGKRAYEIANTGLPKGNWMRALTTAEFAHSLLALGRDEQAKPYYQSAYRDLLATFGPDDVRVRNLAGLID